MDVKKLGFGQKFHSGQNKLVSFWKSCNRRKKLNFYYKKWILFWNFGGGPTMDEICVFVGEHVIDFFLN